MFKIISIITTLLYADSIYADIEMGKQLFNKSKCLECHSTSEFKYRENKVNNFDKLHNRVNSCSINSNTGWFDDEVMDVSRYLNHDFYHFEIQKD